jgi:tetratricopeptide (TPR) repeat protein
LSASLPRRNLVRLLRRAYESFHDGDLDRAERCCADVLASDPGDFDALHLLGLLCLQQQRLSEALRLLSAAVRADPWSADALSNLGLALHGSGKYQEAIACYHRGLEVAPTHLDILYNLGNAYLETGQLADALSRYRDVLSAEPGHVGALVNRGNALVRLNDPVEALASYDAALAAMPDHPQILTNRGHALRRLDRPADALADFRLATTVAPEFPEAHFEAAMAQLALGEFDAGFRAYEWRWKTGAFARYRKSFPSAPWLGDEPLDGKTILLWAEQGFGDTIQFIRYAPALVRQGARVVCEVQPELLPLLSQFEGVDIVAAEQPLPAFDRHCPMLSLPLAFGTRLETIPAAVPYLAASAERQRKWRDRLPSGRARIGLAWSGSSTHKNDANRSMPLVQLAPLLADPSACFVGLQSDLRDGDAEILHGLPNFIHLGGEFVDFADTAAVISQLDVVVSVDTAVAHLAGALGKQVLIVLPHAADFRWMRTREDSPWYPTARLLRQPAFGDWDSVVARLKDELRSMNPAPSAAQGPDHGVRFSLTTSI